MVEDSIKSAFLLYAFMDHNISITGLLKYCADIGLLQGHGIFTIERARDRLETLLGKLKAASLLLDGSSNEHFTMHDVVRNVSISIAIKEQSELIIRHDELYEWLEKNRLKNLTAIKLFYSDICELPDVLACPILGLGFCIEYREEVKFVMDSDQGKLFIGGISWDTTEDTLKNYFVTYGDVLQTAVMRDKTTGKPRGFGSWFLQILLPLIPSFKRNMLLMAETLRTH